MEMQFRWNFKTDSELKLEFKSSSFWSLQRQLLLLQQDQMQVSPGVTLLSI